MSFFFPISCTFLSKSVEERAEIYKAVEEHYRNQVELYELEEKRKSNPLRDIIKGDSKLAKTAREILGTMEDKKIERTEKKVRVAAEGILNNIIESQNDR